MIDIICLLTRVLMFFYATALCSHNRDLLPPPLRRCRHRSWKLAVPRRPHQPATSSSWLSTGSRDAAVDQEGGEDEGRHPAALRRDECAGHVRLVRGEQVFHRPGCGRDYQGCWPCRGRSPPGTGNAPPPKRAPPGGSRSSPGRPGHEVFNDDDVVVL